MAAALWWGSPIHAQTDPVLMTVNGKPVTRSEFEYSYNKSNGENVVDRKSVKEYVDLFINYKLKVEAALDAKLDTMESFRKEFANCRDQQIRPSFVDKDDVEGQAKKVYNDYRQRVDGNGGLVKPAHILVMLRQKTDKAKVAAAKVRIDSIYNALQAGADFGDMARRLSDDKGTAQQGGELPWIEKGQTFKEFETQAYSLQKGQMSKPFESPAGWHIILMKDRRMCLPYDTLRASILQFVERRGMIEKIINQRIDSIAKSDNTSTEDVLTERLKQLETQQPNLRYLIQEYHDGLLIFAMSNQTVWEKAQNDKEGQEQYFKANRKRYKWTEPHYKGIAYHTRDKADVAAVKKAVKGLPFSKWADVLRTTFNQDSILRIRVEKGIFVKGDNKTIDRMVFKTGEETKPLKDFPYDAVYGKKLKAPQEASDVSALVLADYQEYLENKWVETLRQKYTVTVNEDVVQTVNNH